MKIVFLPGVGFHQDPARINAFFKNIQKTVDCECEYFQWKHSYMNHTHEAHHPYNSLPYSKTRSFFSEVILDFQHVLRYSEEMELPEADVYMGHSAGSIIALYQEKPCILFGSPALLIEDLQFVSEDVLEKCLCKNRAVLNVVDNKDIIGFPLNHEHVEDFVYKSCPFNPLSYSPIAAHRTYWKNKKVLNKVVSTLKEWSDS